MRSYAVLLAFCLAGFAVPPSAVGSLEFEGSLVSKSLSVQLAQLGLLEELWASNSELIKK